MLVGELDAAPAENLKLLRPGSFNFLFRVEDLEVVVFSFDDGLKEFLGVSQYENSWARSGCCSFQDAMSVLRT